MKAGLIVQNFGPIKSVNLDLRNVNVFIGPQASGKSALAKVYTICKSPLSFFKEDATEAANVSSFKKKLEEYNVGSFLKEDTFIEFSSELHYFKFERDGIVYDRRLLKKIEELKSLCNNPTRFAKEIVEIIWELQTKLFFFQQIIIELWFKRETLISKDSLEIRLQQSEISKNELDKIVLELIKIENNLSINPALYIPSERSFIPIIKNSILNLINNNVPIPKHILSFGAEYEKASYLRKVLDLDFIQHGMLYKFEKGEDRIYFDLDNSIKLTEAASGIQTIVPLLLPILSKRENDAFTQHSFVIEEPELNLFPKAQYGLIKLVEKDRFDPIASIHDIGTIHTYTTHSPYVLSSFNNLLYAFKVRNHIFIKKMKETHGDYSIVTPYLEKTVVAIIPAFINPMNFSAYQISNGGAEEIIDRETGLIKDNFIDQASDEMGDDFDKLMELMETETA